MELLITYITPLLVVGLGFIFNYRLARLKSSTDFESSIKSEHYKAEVDYYKNKLTQFLNPLISCIEFDNSIWRNLSMLSDANDTFSVNLSKEVEKNHLLSNLVTARDLVRQNLHYVKMNGLLYSQLIEFIRHVSVYESIRSSGENCNPIDVGAPFPSDLEDLLRSEYIETIERYNELVKTPHKAINYMPTTQDAK
ncbi:MAG: hypothetical protein OQK04_03510 [Kangiellaceae bacterium]|nr:hypothetical protein [Kangiellaceae bacterium]MCW8997760.1 hypothetical protein [Kangiellaceae bacterium]